MKFARYSIDYINILFCFHWVDPSPEPWDEWRQQVDDKLKVVREMMKAHERACDERHVSILFTFS